MSTTWYAQLAAQNWTHANQWNTAANGSGSYGTPAPGDTCDLNGKTVNVNFTTSLGGTINVQDTPGTGLLNFNADITNSDTWVCSCNIQVLGGATGNVTLTNLTLQGNASSQNVNIGLPNGIPAPVLTIVGAFAFPLDWGLAWSISITVWTSATLDVSAATFSGNGSGPTLLVWDAFYATAHDNYVRYGCIPQLEPFGYATYYCGSGSYSVGAPPVWFADPIEVALGVDRGDGTLGTRTDCPANEALTTATYGNPGAPFTGTVSLPTVGNVVSGVTFGDSDSLTGTYPTSTTTAAAQLATDVAAVTAAKAGITTATTILGVAGTLDMGLYVLKSSVVSAAQVLVGAATYPGGPAGTFGGLTAAQITQLFTTLDGLDGSYPTVAQIAAAVLSDPSAPIQVDAQGFVRFFYSPQPQPVYTMPANLACSRADVENVFGAENVQKWADVDNCGDPTVIARRIDWSIAWATNELQDLLRDGPYEVDPLPATAAATWVPLAAMLAGWMLSNPRVGEDTVDPTIQRKNSWALKHVQQTVHEIKTGKRRINAVPARRMANVPLVMP